MAEEQKWAPDASKLPKTTPMSRPWLDKKAEEAPKQEDKKPE